MAKKFEYLRKVYDSESAMDFDLSRLGVVGWQLAGVVRYQPSPARVTFMTWFYRELPVSKGKAEPREKIEKKFGLFSPAVKPIGDGGVGRLVSDPSREPPIPWPELIPGINPFADPEEEGDDEEDTDDS